MVYLSKSKKDGVGLRRINHILTIILLLLLEIHVIVCAFLMFGWSHIILENVARVEFIVVMCHAFIGVLLTFRNRPLHNSKKYLKENRLYWLRRVTGIGILILSMPHISMFVHWYNNKIAVLKEVNGVQMGMHLLFLIFILLHLAINIKPMLISMGIRKYTVVGAIIQGVTWILTVFATIASIIYYL